MVDISSDLPLDLLNHYEEQVTTGTPWGTLGCDYGFPLSEPPFPQDLAGNVPTHLSTAPWTQKLQVEAWLPQLSFLFCSAAWEPGRWRSCPRRPTVHFLDPRGSDLLKPTKVGDQTALLPIFSSGSLSYQDSKEAWRPEASSLQRTPIARSTLRPSVRGRD